MYVVEFTQGNGLKCLVTLVSALVVRCCSGGHVVLRNVMFIMVIVKPLLLFLSL